MNVIGFLWRKIVLNDWSRRFSAIFTALLLYQYVSWFSKEADFWWPQTVRIVTFSLLITLLLDLLPLKRNVTRMTLQFAGVLAYNAAALGYRPVGGTFQHASDIWDIVYLNAFQLHPFLWFSLGAWFVYHVTAWWARARWRIVLLAVLSVIVLAMRNSFSGVTLWLETAIVIFCGLSLLMVRHFAEFKRQNPDSFAQLAKHPLSVVFPAVVMLGITLVPALFVSNVAPVVEDPYTLSLQWKVKETASLLEALQVLDAFPTGRDSSGYGRDDSNLGGGFNFDYSPVMEVVSARRSYWRGETRSFYTGSGWAAGNNGASGPVDLNMNLVSDSQLPSNQVKKEEVRQTVTILQNESYPVLFGAFPITKLENIADPAASRDMLRWAPGQSELRWLGKDNRAYPKTYTIVSQVPLLDEVGLRKAPVQMPNRVRQEYLQLSENLPNRVRQLARDLTEAAPTPYDKAKAIEQYLRKEYSYTNKPDDSKGQSGDFVDRFLFEIREGYCDYYSTAMVVLARSSGLPARWVKGYVSGENTARIAGESADSSDGGTYLVRNSDAHSWVEVYFTGWGWIPFEPTSGFTLPSAASLEQVQDKPDGSQADQSTPASPPADSVEKPDPGIAAGIIKAIVTPESPSTAGSIVTIALGLALVPLLWFGRKRIREFLRRVLFGRRTETENGNDRVIVEFNRLLRLYKRKGFAAYEHETARETIERWKEKDFLPADDLDTLLMLFEKAKYSPRGVTAEESSRIFELVGKLRNAVKRRNRNQLHGRNA